MIRTSKHTEISVIFCNCDPKQENLERALETLHKQTLYKEAWELIFIDSINDNPPGELEYFSRHHKVHYIYEPDFEMTRIRMRGINNAKGELIVFTDNNNLLDLSFLEKTLEISRNMPWIGAWGGTQIPEYMVRPSEWMKRIFQKLFLRKCEENSWVNFPLWKATPGSAGLCMRKNIAQAYIKKFSDESNQMSPDSRGRELYSVMDMDLVYTACDMEYGIGRFKELRLIRIITPDVLDKKYFIYQLENFFYSLTLLRSKRTNMQSIPVDVLKEENLPDRELYEAKEKGVRRAENILNHTGLTKKTNTDITINSGDILLVTVLRNEMMRLPSFLDHHFSLGINKIFIIDNGSTDGTGDIQRENVYVFTTNDHFVHKPVWIDEILQTYGIGHWCLILDGDELFIYPRWNEVPLTTLCAYLDESNKNALHAHLLDMYPGGNINKMTHTPGEDLLSLAPYFDPEGYYTLKTIGLIESGINYHIYGGMRKRVFDMDVCLSKHPLIKYSPAMKIGDGTHNITNARTGQLRGAILHFKYLDDFYYKVVEEFERKAYLMSGEYDIYHRWLTNNHSIYYEGSEKYTDSCRLIELGIMNTTPEFDEYADRTGQLT